MEEVILRKAGELFFTYGCKSVSMDDLAKNAGVSKKTIYQFVSDKNELVEKVMQALLAKHQNAWQQCRLQAKDAVEEVVLETKHSFYSGSGVHYCFIYDVEKFFPSVYDHLTAYRKEFLNPHIRQNMERGIREELYRQDLDIDFLAEVRLQQMLTALNPDSYFDKKLGTQKLLMQFTEFYLHGITNQAGKVLIKKYIDQNQAI